MYIWPWTHFQALFWSQTLSIISFLGFKYRFYSGNCTFKSHQQVPVVKYSHKNTHFIKHRCVRSERMRKVLKSGTRLLINAVTERANRIMLCFAQCVTRVFITLTLIYARHNYTVTVADMNISRVRLLPASVNTVPTWFVHLHLDPLISYWHYANPLGTDRRDHDSSPGECYCEHEYCTACRHFTDARGQRRMNLESGMVDCLLFNITVSAVCVT
jgi:hypothetical protein